MTKYSRNHVLVVFILLILGFSGCKPEPEPTVEFPPVAIPDSEIRQLKSTATGRSYDLYIRYPNNYVKDGGLKYPVLYLRDAQWDFKMLDSIYGWLEYDGYIPSIFIVGITYSGKDVDYNALRAMDFTPVHDDTVRGSGDAPKFLSFIKTELMPFIESNYRIDTSKQVLMGSSYGGPFTLYTLCTEPSLFKGYVASSPVTVYGNRFAFDQEENYAASHKELPARLFIGVGGDENLLEPVKSFINVLEKRNYAGLKMETRIIEGAAHSSNKPEVYTRGLKIVFLDVP